MTVYIVMYNDPEDGYRYPVAVFLNKEAAQKYADSDTFHSEPEEFKVDESS